MKRSLLLSTILLLSTPTTAQQVTLTADPTTGQSPLEVTLTWTAQDCASLTAGGGWSGEKGTSGGSETVTLTSSAEFTLTCTKGSGSAKLSWTPPTQRTDGSPLDNLAGFEIFYGQTQDVESGTKVDVPRPGDTTHDIESLGEGQWYFAMKAYDAGGLRSDLSNTASKVIELASAAAAASVTVTSAPPGAPTLLTIEQYAYELLLHPVQGVRLGRVVGEIPVGAPCADDTVVYGYYRVDKDDVSFKFPEDKVKSDTVVARCKWSFYQ